MFKICYKVIFGGDQMEFGKNSKEREMFAAYYKLCEKYWNPPTTDDPKWWDEMWAATMEFRKKYHDGKSRFAEDLVMALHDRLKSITSNQMRLNV